MNEMNEENIVDQLQKNNIIKEWHIAKTVDKWY